MSAASSAARASTQGTVRDNISGGTINPIVAGILAGMIVLVALIALLLLPKGGK